jgi:hypothetical protein
MKGKQALILSIFLFAIVFSQLASAGWFSGFWLRITGKAVNAPTYCSDSELAGYSFKGIVTVIRPLSIDKYEDYCIDANTLLEYNCNYTNVIDGIGDVYNKSYVCIGGCTNSACSKIGCPMSFNYCLNYSTLQSCKPDGSGYDFTYCPDQQKICKYDYTAKEYACVERECTPGEISCSSYSKLRQCDNIGYSYSLISCPSGQMCMNSSCIVAPCAEENEIPYFYANYGITESCCNGLVSIITDSKDANGRTIYYCTKCGDGICNYPETNYSCRKDCINVTGCTDSDGGSNIYVKGTAVTTNIKVGYYIKEGTDRCQNSRYYTNFGFRDVSSVLEYSCNTFGMIDSNYVDCPNQCVDGACIQNDSQSICGNGICEHDEDMTNCRVDCCQKEGDVAPTQMFTCCEGLTSIYDMPDLQPPCGEALNSNKKFCTKCGDGICTPPETRCNCQIDCLKNAACGNGRCELSFENSTSCPADCSTCGDGYCAGPPYETAASCVWDCSVCGDGICGSPKETSAFCPKDCNATVSNVNPTCTDSDSGINYAVKGICHESIGSSSYYFSDYCSSDKKILSEFACEDLSCISTSVSCSAQGYNSCVEGKCVNVSVIVSNSSCEASGNCVSEENNSVNSPAEIDETVAETNAPLIEGVEETMPAACYGCAFNSTCISFGVRISGTYCDSSSSMLAQKPDLSLCLNSYECESSRCFENECAPQLTFIARIAEWFRAIFTP